MTSREEIVKEIDIEYLIGSYADYQKELDKLELLYAKTINEITRERFDRRSKLNEVIKSKIKNPATEAIYKRVLTIPARYRTDKDKAVIQEFEELSSQSKQDCWNKSNMWTKDTIFEKFIGEIGRKICASINYVILMGKFYEDGSNFFVDVPIQIPETSQEFMYPLSDDDSNEFMTRAIEIYSGSVKQQKLYPELREILNNKNLVKREITNLINDYPDVFK